MIGWNIETLKQRYSKLYLGHVILWKQYENRVKISEQIVCTYTGLYLLFPFKHRPYGHLFSFQTSLNSKGSNGLRRLTCRHVPLWLPPGEIGRWLDDVCLLEPPKKKTSCQKVPPWTLARWKIGQNPMSIKSHESCQFFESSPPELRQHRHLPELPLWHALLDSDRGPVTHQFDDNAQGLQTVGDS